MKALLLFCFLATIALMEGRMMHGRRHMGKCDRLERMCQKGRGRKMVTYCAWNNETESFETVKKSVACMMHAVKCTKNKMEKPLHKGECGDCTEANVCMKPKGNAGVERLADMMDGESEMDAGRKGGKTGRGRGICDADGNKYENMCKFAVARCEAYKEDETILLPESCRKQEMCNRLAGVCNNGTSKRNVTYCAWNADDDDFETVTNGAACFMHCMKCAKPGEKHPLHKGECGNCTKANVCRRPSMMMEGHGDHMNHNDNDNNMDEDDNDEEEDGNTSVGVRGGRKGGMWKGKGKGRGMPKRGRGGKKGGRGGKRGGRGGKKGGKKQPKGGKGKRMRPVCDQDGNEYASMCDFAVARCEQYAIDEKELHPTKCPRPRM